jgi:nucleotidyltransferase substrate binding protein (TIGR01987 family)
MTRFLDKLNKFENFYNRLVDMINFSEQNSETPKLDTYLRIGIIKVFEMTFELSWKTLKEFLFENGLCDLASPKAILQKAFEIGIIKDEKLWSDMLLARNSTTHIYDEELAIYYEDVIKKNYVNLFKSLINYLKGKK